jgi:hypothetical protein
MTHIEDDGTDLGARVNAAAHSAVVAVCGGGTVRTQIVLAPGQCLRLGPGTYACDTPPGVVPFLLASGSSVMGAGWNLTTVVEPTAAGNWTVFRGLNSMRDQRLSDANLEVSGLRVLGANPEFGASLSTVVLGNCHGGLVRDVWLDGVRSLGILVGGDSSRLGNYARMVRVTGCLFTGVVGQPVGVVNAADVSVDHCLFLDPGQPDSYSSTDVDVEPNVPTDRVENILIAHNLHDQRGRRDGSYGNAVHLNAAGVSRCQNCRCLYNTVLGGFETFPAGTNPHRCANGVVVAGGMRDFEVVGNRVLMTSQSGVYVDHASRGVVRGNFLAGNAGPAIYLSKNSAGVWVEGNRLEPNPSSYSDPRVQDRGNGNVVGHNLCAGVLA